MGGKCINNISGPVHLQKCQLDGGKGDIADGVIAIQSLGNGHRRSTIASMQNENEQGYVVPEN